MVTNITKENEKINTTKQMDSESMKQAIYSSKHTKNMHTYIQTYIQKALFTYKKLS